MKRWIKKLGLERLLKDRRGSNYVEYIGLAVIVGVGGMAALKVMQGSFSESADKVNEAVKTAQ